MFSSEVAFFFCKRQDRNSHFKTVFLGPGLEQVTASANSCLFCQGGSLLPFLKALSSYTDIKCRLRGVLSPLKFGFDVSRAQSLAEV